MLLGPPVLRTDVTKIYHIHFYIVESFQTREKKYFQAHFDLCCLFL